MAKRPAHIDASNNREVRQAADRLQEAAVAHAILVDSPGPARLSEADIANVKLAAKAVADASLAFGRAVMKLAKEMQSS